jgi:hypothetical protein
MNKILIYSRMIALTFLIVGALINLNKVFNINIFEKSNLNSKYQIEKIFYLVVAFAGLFVLTRKEMFLPFLGETVLPCSLIAKSTPNNATLEVQIKTEPNKNIIYWASEPSNEIKDVKDAYGKYENSGFTNSDNKGNAILKVRQPSKYRLPYGKILNPHIHYRICGEQGTMSQLYTVFV